MALRGTLRPRKVRRRRELLPQQVGFVCAVLALVCCASGLFGSWGHKTASASKRVLPDTWKNRKLMAPVNGTHTAKNCTDPAGGPLFLLLQRSCLRCGNMVPKAWLVNQRTPALPRHHCESWYTSW
ncbi:Sodium/potassium/calcium exchanger 4 [Tupaia chinensis]|uniref:Sodium/potassium/calcium exchanger 4 n=1 Tax=Tupaia chinensis TaxID=246437 RepID=L9K2W4_TUPCH|nr:Sodium/potassium/calcium exchanger 4 [Tupaia chinensis]